MQFNALRNFAYYWSTSNLYFYSSAPPISTEETNFVNKVNTGNRIIDSVHTEGDYLDQSFDVGLTERIAGGITPRRNNCSSPTTNGTEFTTQVVLKQEAGKSYQRTVGPKTTESRWRPKHTGHIKKPLNAFMLFMKEMRSQVIAECTLKESAAINQILGRKWHALSREAQAKYYELARKEKELHQRLYPGWSARDNYATQIRRRNRNSTTAITSNGLFLSSNGADGTNQSSLHTGKHMIPFCNAWGNAQNLTQQLMTSSNENSMKNVSWQDTPSFISQSRAALPVGSTFRGATRQSGLHPALRLPDDIIRTRFNPSTMWSNDLEHASCGPRASWSTGLNTESVDVSNSALGTEISWKPLSFMEQDDEAHNQSCLVQQMDEFHCSE